MRYEDRSTWRASNSPAKAGRLCLGPGSAFVPTIITKTEWGHLFKPEQDHEYRVGNALQPADRYIIHPTARYIKR
jgi:hypothetical protein